MNNSLMNSALAGFRTCKWGQKLTGSVVISLALAVALTTTACSEDPDDIGDPDEGGIIGSGVLLDGSISATAMASNNFVEAKSSDGRLTQITIDSNNQFSATSLFGIAPWVLSVRPTTGVAVFGIVYSDGTRNINGFSDLSLRRWFAQQSRDLDTEFATDGPFTNLPTASEYADSASRVSSLIEPILSTYNVTGENIISTDYIADDQGIDRFLDGNSVLIENGLVKFIFTDPTTNTQSVSRSALPLDSEFIDNSVSAPTVPGLVRALGSASDEIVVVWEPSIDDIAVLEYQVIRNGVTIATTPYPVYVDSGLMIQPYTYEIVAVDGAGNKSNASSPTPPASPLQMSDVIPPPAPTLLTEFAKSSSTVQLLWAQTKIDDVVRFNVYRGTDALSLEPLPLLQVTSTIATDTTVQENETFCYQVEAVDASNNPSIRSDVLCVTASDEDASNTNLNAPLVEWNLPNTESLSCDQQLSSAQLQQGTTVLAAGCYNVPETLVIAAGATLTLTEGVVLKFGDTAKLIVPQDATFTSNGTAESPVVLTGKLTLRGAWGGVEFKGSKSSGNLLRGTVIQYAGGADTAAAITVTGAESRFRMVDTLVQFNRNRAIKLTSSRRCYR